MVLCSWVTIGPRSGVALAMRHSLSDIQFLRCTWVQCLCKKYEQPFHYRVWCLCFYILLDQLVDALFRHHSFTVEPECHQTNQQTNQPVNFPLFHHGYFLLCLSKYMMMMMMMTTTTTTTTVLIRRCLIAGDPVQDPVPTEPSVTRKQHLNCTLHVELYTVIEGGLQVLVVQFAAVAVSRKCSTFYYTHSPRTRFHLRRSSYSLWPDIRSFQILLLSY